MFVSLAPRPYFMAPHNEICFVWVVVRFLSRGRTASRGWTGVKGGAREIRGHPNLVQWGNIACPNCKKVWSREEKMLGLAPIMHFCFGARKLDDSQCNPKQNCSLLSPLMSVDLQGSLQVSP